MKAKSVAILVVVVVVVIAAYFVARLWPYFFPSKRVIQFDAALANAEGGFSFDRYGKALADYVDDDGWVNYAGLKEKGEDLETFGAMLAVLDAQVYEAWSEAEKVAFWINTYNALTLKAIIDHYPITGSLPGYPKSSIRQIPGAWKALQYVVMGQKRTLDEIEHKILRAKFNEPRIHVALVCAAWSCPPLRNEPYVGGPLDKQLEDQSRRFLAMPRGLKIDRDAGHVHVSSIFSWFGGDFVKTYGTDEKFAGRSETERAVLNYISGHVSDKDREYLETGDYGIKYLDYDWSLNERPN